MYVREYISGTAYPNFTKFSARVTYGRGSVFLGCAATCTSGFVDDVIFSLMGRMAQATQV